MDYDTWLLSGPGGPLDDSGEACDCGHCAACEQEAELIAVGLELSNLEIILLGGGDLHAVYGPPQDAPAEVEAPSDEVAPLACDVCHVECLTDWLGIPCCGSRSCVDTLAAEVARDHAEMDRMAAVQTRAMA